MSEKYVVTWDMFQMHARKLAERLLPATQWTVSYTHLTLPTSITV